MITTICKHLGYAPAQHHLPNHHGLCRNPHGHNYGIEVECTGEVQRVPGESDEGMVHDFGDISAAWAQIKPVWDHMDLNTVLTVTDVAGLSGDATLAVQLRMARGFPELTGPTTAENLAVWLLAAFRRLGVPATALTLWETPTSRARVEL